MSKYRHAKQLGIKQIAIIGGIAVCAIALIIGIIFAVTAIFSGKDENQNPTAVSPSSIKTDFSEVPTEPHEENTQLTQSALAKKYLDTMTVDEKIYQMLLVSPEALTGVDSVTEAGPTTQTALAEKPVGGILYSQQNFTDEATTMTLISNTKSYAKTPLFIAVQEEGGDHSPLASALELQTPYNMSTYSDQGETVAFKNADAIATYLAKYGFNMNLAPYAGLTGDTSFSEDPATAGALASQAMLAYQSKSIVSVVHSFPDANETDELLENMKTKEFVPYVTAIQKGADTIMVSTSKANSIDEYPAFMAKIIVNDILRDQSDLGFNGLVMSGIISADTISYDQYIVDDIVVSAINSGVNMFVCADNVDAYYNAIKTALDKKLITIEQINECVTNILTIKFKYGIIEENFDRTPVDIEEATQEATEEETQTPTDLPTESSVPETDPSQDPSQVQY